MTYDLFNCHYIIHAGPDYSSILERLSYPLNKSPPQILSVGLQWPLISAQQSQFSLTHTGGQKRKRVDAKMVDSSQGPQVKWVWEDKSYTYLLITNSTKPHHITLRLHTSLYTCISKEMIFERKKTKEKPTRKERMSGYYTICPFLFLFNYKESKGEREIVE